MIFILLYFGSVLLNKSVLDLPGHWLRTQLWMTIFSFTWGIDKKKYHLLWCQTKIYYIWIFLNSFVLCSFILNLCALLMIRLVLNLYGLRSIHFFLFSPFARKSSCWIIILQVPENEVASCVYVLVQWPLLHLGNSGRILSAPVLPELLLLEVQRVSLLI